MFNINIQISETTFLTISHRYVILTVRTDGKLLKHSLQKSQGKIINKKKTKKKNILANVYITIAAN